MPPSNNRNNNLPKQLKLGKTNGSQEAKVPTGGGSGGNIQTSLPEIKWTKRKLTLTTFFLCVPYTAATVAALGLGYKVIGSALVGLGLFVLGMYWLLRFLEKAEL